MKKKSKNPNIKKMPHKSAFSRTVVIELFFASFIALFQELAIIRWLSGQVRVIAYFPNLILLSAFLGLGLGCLKARGRSLFLLWPTSLLVLVGVTNFLSGIAFTQNSVSEHLWLLYGDLPKGAPVVQGIRLPIILIFILSAITFIPLGQIVASRLKKFQEHGISLWGYSWDIIGSLAGVISFSILGFIGIFPCFWFMSFLVFGSFFFFKDRRALILYLVFAAVILGIVIKSERALYYSPYYAISIEKKEDPPGLVVMTNGSVHQQALTLKNDYVSPNPSTNEALKKVREGYNLPYTFLKTTPNKALVLGAGTGNDIAVMLNQGIKHIDAVEIDPVILSLGKNMHPDKPYDSSSVRSFNVDARSFLNNTTEKYDLIIFGTLDSMTKLSALSNIRLDNFVYTLDCIKAASSRLTQNGGIVIYFMVEAPYIDQRLEGMLAKVFGRAPLVVNQYYSLFNKVCMGGPAFYDAAQKKKIASATVQQDKLPSLNLPTDDWPFLYLKERGISSFYLSLIFAIVIIALVSVAFISSEMRSSIVRWRHIDIEMFLFGLSFLLLETKSVTEMNLVWGATWLTSAVVFGSILLMILFATMITILRPVSLNTAFIGLVLSLFIGYFIPTHFILGEHMTFKLIMSIITVGFPIFFAAVCFALIFKTKERVELAFGWNLLGAVAGGLLEFTSMILGLKAMILVALAAYIIAFFLISRKKSDIDIGKSWKF